MNHYTHYSIDINLEKISENTFFLSPTFTVKHEARTYSSDVVIDNSIAKDSEKVKSVIAEALVKEIVKNLKDSIEIISEKYVNSSLHSLTVFKVRTNVVLEDERKIYDAKEKMLIDMVVDANNTIGRAMEKNRLIEHELKKYKSMSFVSRLKFLFKGE